MLEPVRMAGRCLLGLCALSISLAEGSAGVGRAAVASGSAAHPPLRGVDECQTVLQAVCGNMTTSVETCLNCDTKHQSLLRAALCTNTELTLYCNKAAGSAVQPSIVTRLLYDAPPPPNAALRVHAWDPAQHRLFSGGADGQIHQWSLATQTRLPSLIPPHNLSAPITELHVDPARYKLFSSSAIVPTPSSNVTPPYPLPRGLMAAPPPNGAHVSTQAIPTTTHSFPGP